MSDTSFIPELARNPAILLDRAGEASLPGSVYVWHGLPDDAVSRLLELGKKRGPGDELALRGLPANEYREQSLRFLIQLVRDELFPIYRPDAAWLLVEGVRPFFRTPRTLPESVGRTRCRTVQEVVEVWYSSYSAKRTGRVIQFPVGSSMTAALGAVPWAYKKAQDEQESLPPLAQMLVLRRISLPGALRFDHVQMHTFPADKRYDATAIANGIVPGSGAHNTSRKRTETPHISLVGLWKGVNGTAGVALAGTELAPGIGKMLRIRTTVHTLADYLVTVQEANRALEAICFGTKGIGG